MSHVAMDRTYAQPQQHYTILITEITEYIGHDGYPAQSYDEYVVTTRAIDEFIKNDPGAWMYVERIIIAALDNAATGKAFACAGRKYSFTDAPEWYEALAAGVVDTDPVIKVEVDRG